MYAAVVFRCFPPVIHFNLIEKDPTAADIVFSRRHCVWCALCNRLAHASDTRTSRVCRRHSDSGLSRLSILSLVAAPHLILTTSCVQNIASFNTELQNV